MVKRGQLYNSWSRDAINQWASFLQNSWNFLYKCFLLNSSDILSDSFHLELFLPAIISKNYFSAFIFIVSINRCFTPSKKILSGPGNTATRWGSNTVTGNSAIKLWTYDFPPRIKFWVNFSKCSRSFSFSLPLLYLLLYPLWFLFL